MTDGTSTGNGGGGGGGKCNGNGNGNEFRAGNFHMNMIKCAVIELKGEIEHQRGSGSL